MYDLSPQIITIAAKTLVGKKRTMSFAKFTVSELWKSFLPVQHHIQHKVGTDLFSVAIYPPNHFTQFNPQQTFERWAAVEVSTISTIPKGMEQLVIPEGLYAVFHYKGNSNDSSIFQKILGEWLPASGYQLDDRPHFEVLGAGYKNNAPDSEEDIYIPIQPR